MGGGFVILLLNHYHGKSSRKFSLSPQSIEELAFSLTIEQRQLMKGLLKKRHVDV